MMSEPSQSSSQTALPLNAHRQRIAPLSQPGYSLAIDQGTTSSRAIIFDRNLWAFPQMIGATKIRGVLALGSIPTNGALDRL